MKTVVEREIAGRKMTITTGEVAKQAAGAVLIQYGETVVLVATQNGPLPAHLDFFPLTVDYRERYVAAGKFPGGFMKREGKPTTHEVLTMRLTDRPIRPLFPKWYREELQIMSTVLSVDGENLPDVLSINGASAGLMLAPVPYKGPIGAVRVGLIDDEFVAFPTHAQLKESELDLVVAGTRDSILMIEGFGKQIPEDIMVDALMYGHEIIQEICDLQDELVKASGIKKPDFAEPAENPFIAKIRSEAAAKIRTAKTSGMKQERAEAVRAVKDELKAKYFPEGATETADGLKQSDFANAFDYVVREVVRQITLDGTRLDGRKPDELRQITCAVGNVPRVHGSALFTRGETQSLATVALGTTRDAQRVENLFGEHEKRFMLDYNFPPYSVGECKPLRGPGRREIGHGALAERSVEPVIPEIAEFPYTIRVISDITESNGSSSMASVCNATLSLMDAGVKIKQPVAGISIGLVKEGKDYMLLTDIMGDEDHFGDMDFKVAGTQKGITGIQLDLKIDGINREIITKTLEQARGARIELLKVMLAEIRRPRKELSPFAPRLRTMKIPTDKIGLLIGPGGKTIRQIQEESGSTLDIDDSGTVFISAPNEEKLNVALARVEALTEEIRVGRIYNGKVIAIKDFGAFIEIAPGKDGLCHISELSNEYVRSVNDVVKIGDLVKVKVIAVDDQNRVKLSRKVLLTPEPGEGGEDEVIEDNDDDV